MHSISKTNRSNADWMAREGHVLFSWSTINPDGPTIYCIGTTDVGSKGGRAEVFWRWMHYLGGESHCLGYVDQSDPNHGAELVRIVHHALAVGSAATHEGFAPVTVVPSFVMPPDDERWSAIMRKLLAGTRGFREADWGRQIYFLSKYGSEFLQRAAEETRETCERASSDPNADAEVRQLIQQTRQRHEANPAFANWKPGQYQSRPLQAGDVEQWWNTVRAPEFRAVSLIRLAQAWVGACHMMQADLPIKTNFEAARDFLAHFGHAYWPADWTTELVADGMGLTGPVEATPLP